MFESVISYGVIAHLHVHASAVILIAMIVWKSLLVSSSDIGVSGLPGELREKVQNGRALNL